MGVGLLRWVWAFVMGVDFCDGCGLLRWVWAFVMGVDFLSFEMGVGFCDGCGLCYGCGLLLWVRPLVVGVAFCMREDGGMVTLLKHFAGSSAPIKKTSRERATELWVPNLSFATIQGCICMKVVGPAIGP
jgi:hypothetical protein